MFNEVHSCRLKCTKAGIIEPNNKLHWNGWRSFTRFYRRLYDNGATL